MNVVQTLQFQDTQFTITDINGKPWLRGYQIGNALQYSNGAVAISKLYDRNADEFTESMTQVVELQTAGGLQKVRVFSLRGCHLLGMLAKTAKAKEFRRWVLDILEQTTMPTTPEERIGLRQAVSAVVGKHRIDYSTAYSLIHQRFNVEHIDELTHEQLGEAVKYCHGLILDGGLWGEVLDAPEPAKHNPNMPAIKRAAERMCEYFEQTAPAVKHLNRPIYAAFIEHYKVLKIYAPELV